MAAIQGTKKTTRTVRSDPADTADAAQTLTPARRRELEALRVEVNALVKDSDRQYDRVADRLFTVLYDGVTEAALDPNRNATSDYRAMAEMTGDTLRIDRNTLSRAVRIGALNAHLRSGPWHRLDWSMKIELLPLLGLDVNLGRLEKGAAQAVKAGATTRTLRAWVAEQVPASEKGVGRPDGLSAAAAAKFLDIGRRLRKVATRRLFADRLRRLEKGAFTAAVGDLEATIRSLTLLREELRDEAADA